MKAITQGMQGAGVEDVQMRLTKLGYEIARDELDTSMFGKSTAQACSRFRQDHRLSPGSELDGATWARLVDEGYSLGDRTLYLRLPNFHGRDVFQLQERLNILGFSCGQVDGYFGAYTESALKQFQESAGILADGMAFPDTFDAIDRLHHVWSKKSAQEASSGSGSGFQGAMSFARAAEVLEKFKLGLLGSDAVTRNIIGRIWNLAQATTEKSGLFILSNAQKDTQELPKGTSAILSFSCSSTHFLDHLAQESTTSETEAVDELQELPGEVAPEASIVIEDFDTLPLRLKTALEVSQTNPPEISLILPCGEAQQNFTVSDAQTLAILILDVLCASFA